jgi:hypothetical protein
VDLSGYSDDQLFDQVLRPRLNREFVWTELLEGGNAARIRSILTERLGSVQSELSMRKSALQADTQALRKDGKYRQVEALEAEFEAWRARAVKYVQLLQSRLAQAKRADVADRERQEGFVRREDRETLRRLAVAVAEHQEACAALGLEPSAADMALWGILDDLTVAYGASTATLSHMIDHCWTGERDAPAERAGD